MKVTLRNGNWMLTVPLVMVSVVYLFFLFLPAQREIERLRGELHQRRQSVTALHERQRTIYQTNQELQRAERYVAEWKQKSKDDAASVLARISNEVERCGVQTIRFDPEATERLETLRKTPLELGTLGSFRQLFQMLRQLEALPATVWIEQFHVAAPAQGGGPLSNEVTLGIFTVNAENSN